MARTLVLGATGESVAGKGGWPQPGSSATLDASDAGDHQRAERMRMAESRRRLDEIDGIDFALAAYREEGDLDRRRSSPTTCSATSRRSAHALRRFPGDGGAVGLVAIDEDFFVIVRVAGPTHPGAALRHHRRRRVGARQLGRRRSSACRRRRTRTTRCPAGDLDLLGDLGMHAMDMGVLLDDVDLYPDEMLSDVARRLGFGELFDDAVGLTSA